jgi:hypothetical protein
MRKEILIEEVREKYRSLSPHLTERSRRIWAAAEVKTLGSGGKTIIYKATGLDYKTIKKGEEELKMENTMPLNRVRKNGGGRKKKKDTEKGLLKALDSLIEPHIKGDPETSFRWTCKSTYKLAIELAKEGYPLSQKTVYNILREQEFGIRGNKKEKSETKSHPDRNAQFEYISKKVIYLQKKGCPTLSVDTKKKENIGNYKNGGKEWQEKGKNTQVLAHDFPDTTLGKVAPYGVYDIGKNQGWVSVGISSDTAAFAVNTIRSWWWKMGKNFYQNASAILITADCGGSNGNKVRLWKIELQKLANELQKEIYVSHFPPGTSKWNKIEHRMFSYISQNWRGRPLISRETVVNCIGNTTTKTGLLIQSQLDKNTYEKGIKISDEELAKVKIVRDKFHGEWNYSILPQKP